MNARKFGGFFLAAALTVSMSAGLAVAQNDSGAKQDMKNAGHDTKDAAKETGHGIKQGTKKAYHKTRHGIHKAHRKIDPDTNSNPR